jgi:aryl-alcohol dehydrogenase-like predicted oxidoreductase
LAYDLKGNIMQTRQLGKSNLSITPIGFGSWAIGGSGYQFAWGPQDDNESIAAIQRALDLGINWIDTAAVYGLGHSEEIVARAIKGCSPRPYVFTKCGMVWDEQGRISGNLKRDSLRRELEASLKRLQTEVIDLYQVHWPDPDPDIEEGIGALAEFQREGKIRYIGVSNFNVEQMCRALPVAQITSLQPPYSLVDRAIEKDILPFCAQQQIGVIVYSPMASGLLTGKMTRERIERLPEDDWRKHDSRFQEPQLSQTLEIAARLREIGQRYGRSPAEVAIAWTLRRPEVTAAIVGARRPEQVEGIMGAADFRLSGDEIAELESRGLLSYGR